MLVVVRCSSFSSAVFGRSCVCFQRIIRTGTSKTKSQKEYNRVLWTNVIACVLIAGLVPFTILRSLLSSSPEELPVRLVAIRYVNVLVFGSSIALNKFGNFGISKLLLICQITISVTVISLATSSDNDVDLTPLYFAPVAISFTLFDAASPKDCLPLALVVTLCLICVRWINNPSGAQVYDAILGLFTAVVIGVCFHLLAQENLYHEEELKINVARLTKEMRARKVAEASLRKSNKVKQDFLATMSHEIRTPMNGVVASVDLLNETPPLNGEQKDLVATITSSVLALVAIINDILDFSKIEAGNISIESEALNVRHLTEGVLDCLAARADERGVELVCDVAGPLLSDGVVVLCDPRRFRQVLLKIIGNAVNFTRDGYVLVRAKLSLVPPHPSSSTETGEAPAGGGAVSSLSNSSTKPDLYLIVEVEDSGEGIPPDRIDTLFHAFTQADTSTSRTHGGTGLGLAICSKLVELMGGAIGVKSQLGQGSTFSFFVVVKADPTTSAESLIRLLGDGGAGGRGDNGGGRRGARRSRQLQTGPCDNNSEEPSSCSSMQNSSIISRSSSTDMASNWGGQQASSANTSFMFACDSSYDTDQVMPPALLSPISLPPTLTISQEVLVVVWEPLAKARDALCRLLRHHHQPRSDTPGERDEAEERHKHRSRMELVVRPIPQPEDLGALVQVLKDDKRGTRRSRKKRYVLVCDYRTLLTSNVGVPLVGGLPGAVVPPNLAETDRYHVLSELFREMDVGVVLLGPRPHRAAVEADAQQKKQQQQLGLGIVSSIQLPPSASSTRGSGGLGHGHLAEIFQDNRGRPGRDGTSTTSEGVRRVYVNKPVHQTALLQAVLQLACHHHHVEEPSLTAAAVRSSRTAPTQRLPPIVVGTCTTSSGGGPSSSCSRREKTREVDPGEISCWGGEEEEKGKERRVSKEGADSIGKQNEAPVLGGGAMGGWGEEKSGDCEKVGAAAGRDPTPCEQSQVQQQQEVRVLVVEDNKVNQKVMGKMLTRLGVEFDIAENGQLAVEAWMRQQAQQQQKQQQQQQPIEEGGQVGCDVVGVQERSSSYYYGLVLMDCHMPVMDGYEATAAIRELEGGGTIQQPSVQQHQEKAAGASGRRGRGGGEKVRGRIPIVAVTASALEEELQMCRDVGMDSVMVKPIRIARLYEALAPYVKCSNPGHQFLMYEAGH